MKYLVFGETIWDVYPDKSVIGGAAYNFAAHAALMGADVQFVTGVGDDDLGREAVELMKSYGIGTDFVCVNGKGTGRCIVTLGENGIPSYDVLTDTAYDNIEADDAFIEKIRAYSPDVFYFNTLCQRSPVSEKSIRKVLDSVQFSHIFTDVNVRVGCCNPISLDLCMSRSDIVKISDEEAHTLADYGLIGNGKFAEEVKKAYPNIRLLVYTMGENGSIVYDFANDKEYHSGKPKPVEVVSTVGAGDCYSAAFLHSILSGRSIEESIRIAADRACVVVANTEAIPDVLR